jgi:hypothetical protein
MNNFRLKLDRDSISQKDNEVNKDLIQDKLKYLFSLSSPYEVKNGILFVRNTDKLVSKVYQIVVEDKDGNIQYFTSISECCLVLKISRDIVKDCLITGNAYNNYTFKFDTLY